MPWFKVDDKLPTSRRVLSIPRRKRLAAIGLWTLAGAWAAEQLTDGNVPEYMIEELGGTADLAEVLEKSGLWQRHPDGFRFKDWEEYNPSRAAVLRKRKDEADRKAEWRARKAASQSKVSQGVSQRDNSGTDVGTSASVPVSVRDSSALPDPTRPDPTPTTYTSGGADKPPAPPPTAAQPAEETAQTLIAEWIDHCDGGRPPSNVIGQIAKHVGQMLDEGIPYCDVRRGLQQWQDKGLHPSTLPSVVHETRTAKPAKPRRQAETDDLFARAAARLGVTSPTTPQELEV